MDPLVTNITSGRHKQKGLNLLFFNFLSSAWPLASWYTSSLHFLILFILFVNICTYNLNNIKYKVQDYDF